MYLGQVFELNFEVTEKTYECFLSLSNDHNPMHVDSEYANKYGFKNKIVHGNVLGAYVSYFVGEGLPDKNVVIQKQDILYHKPFFVGDSLKMKAILEDIYESVSTFVFKYKFFNQKKELIAKGTVQISLLS